MTTPQQAAKRGSLESLVAALRDPSAYAHPVGQVDVIETHISFVLLAGAYAYKLKKPVSLGFVDFSTLERRRHFCHEEVRINRRLAPGLYLDVVSLVERNGMIRVQSQDQDQSNSDGLLDHGVRMRRFPRHAVLTETPVDRGIVDRLAQQIAAFHLGLPPAAPASPFGGPDQVLAPMLANVRVLRQSPLDTNSQRRVDQIAHWTRQRWRALKPLLAARKTEGWIRECHGDLHRGNIALLDGEPTIFDALEFNPELRWIDCVSDLAFLAMDLREIGATALERRLINAYLERTGDYAGLRLLAFYQVYRAMVRAKVSGIRLGQLEHGHPDAAADQAQAQAQLDCYLRLAEDYTQVHQPRLLITHGLSGSGKTWLGHALRERVPVIQIRSDVERKRLFATERNTQNAADLYGKHASQQTYQRLLELAEQILLSGYGVFVDAAFLRAEQRDWFRALAHKHDCDFAILALKAPPAVLKARVQSRLRRGNDASDADTVILARQQEKHDPLSPEENRAAIHLDTESPAQIAAFLRRMTQESDSHPPARPPAPSSQNAAS